MARGAARIITMLGELLTDGHRAADVRFDGLHRRRRRTYLDAEYPLGDPVAAQYRRGGGAVGGHFEHAGHGHQAAAFTVGRQRDAAHLRALHTRDAIVPGETL